MLNIIYRPELESPPMAKECTVTFSKLTGTGESDGIVFRSGINRDIPPELWEEVKKVKYAQTLLSLGALRVLGAEELKEVLDEDELKPADDVTISDLKAADAVEVIDDTHDVALLNRWLAKERRIPVRNSIQRRLTTLTGGDA